MSVISNLQKTGISRRSFIATSALATASLALSGPAIAAADTGNKNSSAAEVQNVTFCLDYTPNTNHIGIYVAQELGFFDEQNLKVTIVQPAEDSAEAILAIGQAQFGVSYQDYLAGAYSNGMEGFTAIAAILQHNTSGIMSLASSNINRPKDLEGKRYTTWELPVELATVQQVVEKDGGDWSKVLLVPYAVEDDLAGLRANMYDAVWVFEGWAVKNAEVNGVDVNYFSFISIDDVFDFYTPILAVNDKYAKEHPDTVRNFLVAAAKGYEYTIEHPKEAAEILCKAVPELDSDLVEKSVEFLAGQFQADAEQWGVIDSERWARFFAWLNENDLVNKKLDIDAGWTNEYLPQKETKE